MNLNDNLHYGTGIKRGHSNRDRKWHREHRRHHTNYGELHGWDKVDWDEMIIDWECCHFTKKQQPLNAPETLVELFSDRPYFRTMQENILPKLRRLINNENC